MNNSELLSHLKGGYRMKKPENCAQPMYVCLNFCFNLVTYYKILILDHPLLHSPWGWDQIGIKLGTKHVIYQKLANFL